MAMPGFLNILAALMLTILPALRPCDCRGFSFTCACALASQSQAAEPSASSAEHNDSRANCGCCCHAKLIGHTHSRTKADDSPAQNRKPGLPAPRKSGVCLKFLAHGAGAALLISFIEPMVLLPVRVSLFPEMESAPSNVGPVHFQAERPPPLFGLIFAEIKVIRI